MWLRVHGHDDVAERFRRILAANRLASTYLFVGPEGIGKRTFALQLAQALLCTVNDPAQLDPCGQCESCRLFSAGTHPDFDAVGFMPGKRQLLIEQFIGTAQTRNQAGLCHDLAMRPLLARRRVAIIDEADWLTLESANCLLKTLEEPPPGAVVILIGTSPSRQLPTILSRSQVVRFNPLPRESLRELILQQGLASDPADADALATGCEGSIARAAACADARLLEMQDRVMSQWRGGSFDAARLVRELEEFINEAGKEADLRRARFRQLLVGVGRQLGLPFRDDRISAECHEANLAALDRTLEAEEQLDRYANQATLLEAWIDDLSAVLEGPPPTAATGR